MREAIREGRLQQESCCKGCMCEDLDISACWDCSKMRRWEAGLPPMELLEVGTMGVDCK